ncbi:hypothetical protein EDB19DRAFT_367362, partial [Suillus lakei]
AILKGHIHYVRTFSLSGNNRLLVSASTDKTARLWNLDNNLPVGPPLQHEDQLQCAALSTDGKVLVTGCNDKNAYTWDVQAVLEKAGLEDLLLPIPDVLARMSLKDSGATRPPSMQQLPPGFLDDAQSNTDGATKLQQHPRQSIVSRDPRIVAATPDKGPLVTAPPPAQQPWWTRVIRFLCCAPFQHADGDAAPTRQQEGRSQGQVQTHTTSPQTQQQQPGQSQGQVQASAPQTQPAAPSTSAMSTSSSRPDGLISHLFSLFRSQPHTNEGIEVPQRPSRPHVVGVAAMEDRGALFVADSQPQPDLPHPQSARSRPLQLLAHLGLYLCCICNHQQQQGQVQAQASSSQTQPVTSVTPTSSSRPNAPTTRLTSFSRSQPHINEDIELQELGQVQAQASSSQTQPEASSSQTQPEASSSQIQPAAPSTSVTPTSTSRLDAFTTHQTSLFHSGPRTNEDIELRQPGQVQAQASSSQVQLATLSMSATPIALDTCTTAASA